MADTLAAALPREIQRVSELLPLYDEIPTGVFAATVMRMALQRAQKAIADGDLVGMIQAYEELKGFEA